MSAASTRARETILHFDLADFAADIEANKAACVVSYLKHGPFFLSEVRLREWASHRKADATATTGRGIWVFDGEAGADQFFGEINHSIGEKRQGHFVDHDFLADAFEDEVPVGGLV